MWESYKVSRRFSKQRNQTNEKCLVGEKLIWSRWATEYELCTLGCVHRHTRCLGQHYAILGFYLTTMTKEKKKKKKQNQSLCATDVMDLTLFGHDRCGIGFGSEWQYWRRLRVIVSLTLSTSRFISRSVMGRLGGDNSEWHHTSYRVRWQNYCGHMTNDLAPDTFSETIKKL